MSWSVEYTFKSPLSAEAKATAQGIIVDVFGDTSGPIGAGTATFYGGDALTNVAISGHSNAVEHEPCIGLVVGAAMTAFTKMNASGIGVKKVAAPYVNLLAYENGYIVLR